MRNFLATTSFFFLVFIFISNIDCLAQQPTSIPPMDSLNYSKEEYDFMRSTLSSDTSFMKMLSERIAQGDTNAVKMKKFLNTPYESRLVTTAWTDNDIKVAIYAFNVSQAIRAKFEELDRSLDYIQSDSLRSKTDSLIQEIRKINEELNSEE